jgi:hypothetical protein
MEITQTISKEQRRFSMFIERLIKEKVIPAQVVIYLYYQRGNSNRYHSLSFSTANTDPLIKNEVSDIARRRVANTGTAYNDHHVCFSNITITTHAGIVINGKLLPLKHDECMAISKIVGASVLHVGRLLSGSILSRSIEDDFTTAVTLAEFEELIN